MKFTATIDRAGETAAGIRVPDEVVVRLVLDAELRELTVPADLDEALEREPEAKRFFSTLSYSEQRWSCSGSRGRRRRRRAPGGSRRRWSGWRGRGQR